MMCNAITDHLTWQANLHYLTSKYMLYIHQVPVITSSVAYSIPFYPVGIMYETERHTYTNS